MRRIADYELGELIGIGNHGRFFKAKPPERLGVEDEWVAVKVLDRHATADDYRRFANEIRIFAAVESEFLARPIDAGQDEAVLFYTTRFYPLGSLARPARELPAEHVLTAVAQAARGAHALHEVGVAHRDVKPSNVLVVEGGGHLADLGLAQALNPAGMTVTGTGPIGSLECMEPGRVLGYAASRSTDIWELGATLHRVLTGRSVFGDIPTSDIVAALRHITNTSPSVDPGLEPGVRMLIESCIDSEVANRPATAEELAVSIEALSA